MNYKNKLSISLVFILFFVFSCSNQNLKTQIKTEIPTSDEGYPVNEQGDSQNETDLYNYDSSYPIYETENEENYLVPEIIVSTPTSGYAVVHGNLKTINENEPYIAPSLFLGRFIESQSEANNLPGIASISVENDPKAIQTENGVFMFTDVPPGNYGLFIWTPVNAFIIEDENSSTPIIIEVKSGETYDLGTIYVP